MCFHPSAISYCARTVVRGSINGVFTQRERLLTLLTDLWDFSRRMLDWSRILLTVEQTRNITWFVDFLRELGSYWKQLQEAAAEATGSRCCTYLTASEFSPAFVELIFDSGFLSTSSACTDKNTSFTRPCER